MSLNSDILKKLKVIFSRYIVVFGGEYGRCKSLSLTALCFYESVIMNRDKIISNMPLKYPVNVEIIPLIQTKQFDFTELNEIQGSIIIWDEIFNDILSRNSMSESNKYITQMGVGFRKDDIHLRGSLQFFDTLEMMMGQMLEMIIIPTFINKYSNNSDEDLKIRLQKNDFWVKWKCFDKKQGNEFEIKINLYPQISWYNTKFKPYKLVLNHKSYMEKLQKDKKNYYLSYLGKVKDEIELNITNWNKGLDEINRDS